MKHTIIRDEVISSSPLKIWRGTWVAKLEIKKGRNDTDIKEVKLKKQNKKKQTKKLA